jgi:hypothetical protein
MAESQGNNPLGRPRCRKEDDIKIGSSGSEMREHGLV